MANLLATDRPPRAIEEPLAEGEYERALADIQVSQLRSLLSGLSERERTVVRARYGLGGGAQSLRRIASGMGLSAEEVRQIEQRALGKLRAALA